MIGSKWVFKIKHDENGHAERYKCRLVAQGYTQAQGIDYHETFAPVARFGSIRTLLAIAAKRKMYVHQMDVHTAFLNGKLEEDIYMSQPEGFEVRGKEDLVCHLHSSLYGLKQSPRCWNKELSCHLVKTGFQHSMCVFPVEGWQAERGQHLRRRLDSRGGHVGEPAEDQGRAVCN